jgi:hypothetical protein
MAKTRVPQIPRDAKFRGLYCLLLSLLVESDHSASGGHVPRPQFVTHPRLGGSATLFQNSTQ